jgi:hypothetical protein
MFKKFPWKKYRIEWLDISGETGWGSVETTKKMEPQLAVSEGYLFYEDENKVITFATYYHNQEEGYILGDRNVFPKGCIKSMKRL